MKKYIIQYLLLFSLSFNIAHASIIAQEDTCAHETAYEYIMELSQEDDCGDVCDIHHLFHFTAILDTPLFSFVPLKVEILFVQKSTLYTPPFPQTSVKPPIA